MKARKETKKSLKHASDMTKNCKRTSSQRCPWAEPIKERGKQKLETERHSPKQGHIRTARDTKVP